MTWLIHQLISQNSVAIIGQVWITKKLLRPKLCLYFGQHIIELDMADTHLEGVSILYALSCELLPTPGLGR